TADPNSGEVNCGHGGRRVGADKASLDEVAVAEHLDTVTIEAIDDQTAHRTARGIDEETLYKRSHIAPIELDEQHRVIAIGERVRTRPGLGVAVDHHWIGDGWQSGSRTNRVHTRSADVEVDLVGPGKRVCFSDRRAERAVATAVVAQSVARDRVV